MAYIIFRFEYSFYNYTSKKELFDFEDIVSKNIDSAERRFWALMNGRDVKIRRVYGVYKDIKTYGRYNDKHKSQYKYYQYLDDGKTRIK